MANLHDIGRSVLSVLVGLIAGFATLVAVSIVAVLAFGERSLNLFLSGIEFYTLIDFLMHSIAGFVTYLIATKGRLFHSAAVGLAFTSLQLLLSTIFVDETTVDFFSLYIPVGTLAATLGGLVGRTLASSRSMNAHAARTESQWEYELSSGETVTVHSTRRQPILLVVLCSAAVGAFVLGAFLLFYDIARAELNRASIVSTGAAVTIGLLCLSQAKMLLAPRAHEILNGNPRKIVLYLRSFEDDAAQGEVESTPQLFLGLSLYRNTPETIIVESFKRLGPVIAVGRPGEGIPVPGATRLYVAHDQWQVVVGDLMQRAGTVVLRAGVSAGLAWELKQTLASVQPERICIVVLPPVGTAKQIQSHFEAVSAAFKRDLNVALPIYGLGPHVLVFNSGGRLEKWNASTVHPLNEFIRTIVSDPVLDQAPIPTVRDQKHLLVLAIALFVIIIILFIWNPFSYVPGK